jgi:hypothetical protein
MRHPTMESRKRQKTEMCSYVCVFTYEVQKTQNSHMKKWRRYYALNPQNAISKQAAHYIFSSFWWFLICADCQSMHCLSWTGTGHKKTAMGTPVHRL